MPVRSGAVHYHKALLVSSLHGLRATLDPDGAERETSISSTQDRGGPRNQDHVEQPGQMTAGEAQVGNGAELENPVPLSRSENDQLTNDGNGGRKKLAPVM